MGHVQDALKLREDILKVAPNAYPQETEEDKWATALLISESYFKAAELVHMIGEYDKKIVQAWKEGKSSTFISYMFATSKEDVHAVLMANGMHAPYVEDLDYSILDVNKALLGDSVSGELKAAILDTYKEGEIKSSFDVLRATTPSKEEMHAFTVVVRAGASTRQLLDMCGRSRFEVDHIINIVRRAATEAVRRQQNGNL